MPVVVKTPTAPLDTMLSHSWLADDQKDAFAASSFVPSDVSVSSHLSPWLVSRGYSSKSINQSEVYVRDDQILACLLNQAFDYLQRSLCNTVAHYILARKGLETWARVTNYYASYFSVHCLLCLQGRTITRLQLDKPVEVQIIPIDLRAYEFSITRRQIGKNPHHETPWKRYYEIYDKYAVPHEAYELISKKAHTTDPTDEAIERNKINYSPFEGFREIRDLAHHQGFSSLFAHYISDLNDKNTLEDFLADLKGFASDPDHKYFARTLLKIALAGSIILSIRAASENVEAEWVVMSQRWRDFLTAVFPPPSDCYLLKFVPLIGSTPN